MAALGLKRKPGEELNCKGGECYRLAFVIITAVCLLGALVSLILVLRTRQFYKSDLYKKFREEARTAETEMTVSQNRIGPPAANEGLVEKVAVVLNMESNVTPHDHEDQDEYVLLDLNDVYGLLDIPPNAKYVLTGLDTLNPVLIIDDKFKLIGEYEETIGTCIAFTEQDTPVVHEETGPSEVNLFSGARIIDSSQPPTKQVKPLCQLHKVLKFKMSPDSESQSATAEEAK